MSGAEALEGGGVADGENGSRLFLGIDHELPDAGDGGGGHAEADEAKDEGARGADAGACGVGLECVKFLAVQGGRLDVREDWARHRFDVVARLCV